MFEQQSRIFEASAVHSLLSLMMKGFLNIYAAAGKSRPLFCLQIVLVQLYENA